MISKLHLLNCFNFHGNKIAPIQINGLPAQDKKETSRGETENWVIENPFIGKRAHPT